MAEVKIYHTFSRTDSSDVLIRLAASHFSGKDCGDMKIIRERGKKPAFDCGDIHFSVSHSGGLWVCAFAVCEIGCDVQERRGCPKYKKLAERWFSEGEAARTLTDRDFYDIWSRKEAYVKLLGTGIDENFRRYDTFLSGDVFLRDFMIPGAEDRFSAAAACGDEFEIEFFDINKI